MFRLHPFDDSVLTQESDIGAAHTQNTLFVTVPFNLSRCGGHIERPPKVLRGLTTKDRQILEIAGYKCPKMED